VISNAPVTLIAKSHKGEELMILNSSDMQAIRGDDLEAAKSITQGQYLEDSHEETQGVEKIAEPEGEGFGAEI
jgi:hypothetical protein